MNYFSDSFCNSCGCGSSCGCGCGCKPAPTGCTGACCVCATGATGPIGPVGPAGARGATGATGTFQPSSPLFSVSASGATAAVGYGNVLNVTSNSLDATLTSPLSLNIEAKKLAYGHAYNDQESTFNLASDRIIPLPNHVLLDGITANAVSGTFTLTQAGVYRLAYHIATKAKHALRTYLSVNGVMHAASLFAVNESDDYFAGEILLNAAANTTVSLVAASATAAETIELGTGNGASLVMQRIR